MIMRPPHLIISLVILGVCCLLISSFIAHPLQFAPLNCQQQMTSDSVYSATDLDGHKISSENLFGKPTLLFFGFTYCPEICPTTLSDISRWLDALGNQSNNLQVLFVTIDPERDTPDKLKAYLGSFDKHIRGLLLSPCDLAIMTKKYDVKFRKIELGQGEYILEHQTQILLLDRVGLKVGELPYQVSDTTAIARLRKILSNTAN